LGIIEEYLLENSKMQIADEYIQTEKTEEIWKEVCKAGVNILRKERNFEQEASENLK